MTSMDMSYIQRVIAFFDQQQSTLQYEVNVNNYEGKTIGVIKKAPNKKTFVFYPAVGYPTYKPGKDGEE